MATNISRAIRHLMYEHNLKSYRQISLITGVSYGTIINWVHGRSDPASWEIVARGLREMIRGDGEPVVLAPDQQVVLDE